MGMAASQGRLLFMTARLSNNEFEQQCVAYSKQRLADSSQKANDEYLEALKATKYQILTGYNGNEATYSAVTYNQLTGYFGNNTVLSTDGSTSEQLTGVAMNKQYIIKDNKGQILVNNKIATAFEQSKGDYNKFLEYIGKADGYPNGYTQVKDTPSQQDVHEAWDKYLVSVDKSINSDSATSLHALGFAYNNEKNAAGEDVDFPTYETKYIASAAPGAKNERIYLNIDTDTSTTPAENKYYVKNYRVIGIPYSEYDSTTGTEVTKYKPAYKAEFQQGTEDYIPLVEDVKFDFSDPTNVKYDGQIAYINAEDGTYTDEYRSEVSTVTLREAQNEVKPLFYEGTTATQRQLYDYAMAVSKQFAADPEQKAVYDPGKITYYQNIFNQMITGGYTTYKEMLDTGYMKATETNENYVYQDEQWLITQLKRGKLTLSYYSALEKEFVGTSLDDDESICEKEDKSKMAIAEQEYNLKMDKLQAEDKQFDLTLNKLEAEHHAIQTEYDAVAKVISKNVEKSFGIFNA